MNTEENDKLRSYREAQDRVRELKGFYTHLITFIVVMPFLIYINYVTYWDYQWFWFPLFGWGIGLATHALTVFGFGTNWEKRKIQQLMEEEDGEINSGKME